MRRISSTGGTSGSGSGGGSGGAAAGKKIDVIIKASDSEFWQSMLAGSQKAGKDFGVKVGLFGPTSETDVNQQVQLVENSISRGADAIVVAPNSSDALNNVIERARKGGTKVIIADTADRRAARSCAPGVSNDTSAVATRRFARVMRCSIALSPTRNARAISFTVNPDTMRNASAIC